MDLDSEFRIGGPQTNMPNVNTSFLHFATVSFGTCPCRKIFYKAVDGKEASEAVLAPIVSRRVSCP